MGNINLACWLIEIRISLLSSCVVSSGLSYAPVRIGARSKETELRNK
jgi:hypothetical protein